MIILLSLLAFNLFPGPPHPSIVSRMVIDYYMENTAFKEEYGMTDINTVEIYMQGEFGVYTCGDGEVRKGYPMRMKMRFLRGDPFKASTVFRVFLFVGEGENWDMFYCPRLYFEDILHGKRIEI